MDIIFKGRRTDVQERFRDHAAGKLGKIGRLDRKAIRIDVEVSQERNPRMAGQRERVELTIRSRGPVVRAEAAADDRYAALDLALAKLETRLRRSGERRKSTKRLPGAPVRAGAGPAGPGREESAGPEPSGLADLEPGEAAQVPGDVVPIQMEGDCPVVVREKFHAAVPMTVSDALLQMELVGHDFYLFRDEQGGQASVVYRRRGYQYGLIRLVEGRGAAAPGRAAGNGRAAREPVSDAVADAWEGASGGAATFGRTG